MLKGVTDQRIIACYGCTAVARHDRPQLCKEEGSNNPVLSSHCIDVGLVCLLGWPNSIVADSFCCTFLLLSWQTSCVESCAMLASAWSWCRHGFACIEVVTKSLCSDLLALHLPQILLVCQLNGCELTRWKQEALGRLAGWLGALPTMLRRDGGIFASFLLLQAWCICI